MQWNLHISGVTHAAVETGRVRSTGAVSYRRPRRTLEDDIKMDIREIAIIRQVLNLTKLRTKPDYDYTTL
jgi:hypothetical protein